MINKNKYKVILRVVRILLVLVPVIILVFAFNKRFILFGELSETYAFKKPGVIISEVTAAGNTGVIKEDENTGEYYQEIKEAPVSFYVNLPFKAKYIDLELNYESGNAQIVQFGTPYNFEDTAQYRFETLENRYVSDLGSENLIVTEDNMSLFRNPKAVNKRNSISINQGKEILSDVLNRIPKESTVALYQVNSNNLTRLVDYHPENIEHTTDTILRGSHEIITYIENEKLDYEFYFKQRSTAKSINPVNVKLLRDSELVEEFPDSKLVNVFGADYSKMIHITRENLPAGVYTIKIETGNNTNIAKITTKQKYMAFKGRLSLDDDNISSSFFVNNNIVFKTAHDTGLQTVFVDDKEVEIEKLNKYYASKTKTGVRNVEIPKSDLVMEFDGIASTSIENIENLTSRFKVIDLEDPVCKKDPDFDYLLSSYYKPEATYSDSGIYAKTFRISDLYVENDRVKFKFSIPCIGNFKDVRINQIKVTLRK
ncbi:MAG: hypothetical protein WCW66_01710 [Patescibacteria group bacterium]